MTSVILVSIVPIPYTRILVILVISMPMVLISIIVMTRILVIIVISMPAWQTLYYMTKETLVPSLMYKRSEQSYQLCVFAPTAV